MCCSNRTICVSRQDQNSWNSQAHEEHTRESKAGSTHAACCLMKHSCKHRLTTIAISKCHHWLLWSLLVLRLPWLSLYMCYACMCKLSKRNHHTSQCHDLHSMCDMLKASSLSVELLMYITVIASWQTRMDVYLPLSSLLLDSARWLARPTQASLLPTFLPAA